VFDRDRFVAECRDAVAPDPSHKAAREVMARAISDPAAVLRSLGEPTRAGIEIILPLRGVDGGQSNLGPPHVGATPQPQHVGAHRHL